MTTNTLPPDMGEVGRLVQAAVQQMDEVMLITTAQLEPPGPRIVFVNAAFSRMTGYEAEQMIGQTPRLLQGPKTDRTALRNLRAVLRRGDSFETEITNYRKDGSEYLVQVRISPVRDTNDATTHYIATQRDVTTERARQLVKRDAEEALRRFADHSEDVFWVADPAQPELLYVSAAYERVWGRSGGTLRLVSTQFTDAVVPEDRARVIRWLRGEHVESSCEEEFRIRRPNGSIRWIRTRPFILSSKTSGARRIAGIAEDITERKQRELEIDSLLARERRARLAAEAATRAKDEFLAVVSHELRSPLNAIRGWAHVLSKQALDPPASKAVAAIQRNTEAQLRLVEDLLDTARIVSGKLRLEIRPVNLTAVLEATLDVMRPAALAKGIVFSVELGEQLGPIQADADRLQQVFWNLLSNAVKFTPQGGRIDIFARRQGDFMQIEIRDTGVGIAKHLVPYVFDRFWQADASSTRRHGGLGLGLALTRHLVELHGGAIWADSDGEGRGVTFTIQIPGQQ